MKYTENTLHLSASDLSSHIACTHLTQLKRKVALGEITAPAYFAAGLDTLRQKGEELERKYLEGLKASGMRVVEISREDKQAEQSTRGAMKAGVDIIYQARLKDGRWAGWADFLRRTENRPSDLGSWSYEVVDTKLSRETKAGAILQICLYSDILGRYQGILPEHMYVRTPEREETYRVDDFMAYYRLMRGKLETAVAAPIDTYPEPVTHCGVCDWFDVCNARRRKDDHLSFVAGMSSSHMRTLRGFEVNTLEVLSHLPDPFPYEPERGSVDSYEKLRAQAALQRASRDEGEIKYELLQPEEGFGFYNLPEPDPGDVFLDFEGDPFVEPSGREYLFGWVQGGTYHHAWAETEATEQKAFEDFMDEITSIRARHPGMHIYHFSAYEPSALKRLMGRYATRENEMDSLLRAGVFVDLHTVVRQSLRAGIESYSLKELEILHDFERQRALREVGHYKAAYECLLENGIAAEATEEMRTVVREYNADDCFSTASLRNWLELERADLLKRGFKIPRPEGKDGEAGDTVTRHQERIKPFFDALMEGLPLERADRDEVQQSRWLLAHMLDWYRREQKSFWWEYFRLQSLPPYELQDERAAIGGLQYTGQREAVDRSVVDTYRFPPQESDIRVGDTAKDQLGQPVGSVVAIDAETGILKLKRGAARGDRHPESIIVLQDIKSGAKEESIIRLAEDVIAHGMDGSEGNRAARALLLRQAPPVSARVSAIKDPQKQAIQWVHELDGAVLPIQGPPGAGKSHTAAAMILELLRKGKTVGITALSHKVISGLMGKVHETARQHRQHISMVQKSGDGDGGWTLVDGNEEVYAMLQAGSVQVAGGTPFMWARPEFEGTVDVMFVDEAGQLSLIDTLALSHAANSLVLLGDPQQLKQPQKGTHPEGTERSALEHILRDEQTIGPDQGVFLSESWRMHPAVCGFISELFYEGRLGSRPENATQKIIGSNPFPPAGLAYVPVVHQGNRNNAPEEVDAVQGIIARLFNGKVQWVDKGGKKQKLRAEDILVIAPYNAQVSLLAAALPDIRVGTVDKFQGQEAPVVIFSMASSSPEDAPRGMEFLYSLNRLNVAVSRAKALCILVASEKLFEPDCKSPAQMRLANALCRFRERVNK